MKTRSFVERHWVRHIEVDFLRGLVGRSTKEAVLDIGSGSGHVTFSLFQEPPATLCLADTSLKALRQAGVLASAAEFLGMIQILRCRGENLPFKGESFDLVLMISSLEHFADDSQAVCESFRVLKPDGILVVTVDSEPHTSTLRGAAAWRFFCKPLVKSELKDGSTFLEALLAQHADLYDVKRRYSERSLGQLLRDCGFSEPKTEALLKSRLSKALYELCVAFRLLSFDVNNPAYRLVSRLYPLIKRSERDTHLGDGYVVGAMAKAVKQVRTRSGEL